MRVLLLLSVTIYVLGLDGLSLQLVREMVKTSDLPSFGRILKDGNSANLRSVYPYVTAPAWTSLFSGVNPGKHGLFDQLTIEDGVARIPNIRRSEVPFLWDFVSWAGKRILVVGMPCVHPVPDVNGVFVSGRFVSELTSSPAGVGDAFDLSGFDYNKYNSLKFRLYRSRNENKLKLKRMNSDLQRRFKTSMALIESEKWDVAVVVDSFPDEFLHTDYENHKLRTELFRIVDHWLGQLLGRMNGDDSLLVVSDHGFGDASRTLYINEWLISKKYALPTTPLGPGRRGSRLETSIEDLGRRVPPVRRISDYARYRLAKIGNQPNDSLPEDRQNYLLSRLDPSSKVVTLGTRNLVWIRFLQRSGPSQGALEQEIVNDLNELRSLRLVKNVYASRDLYHGKYSSKAPGQLLIEPYDDCQIEKNKSAGGLICKTLRTKRGRHLQDGLLISYGSFRAKPGHIVSIYDILPTLLAMLRLPIPRSLDGRPVDAEGHVGQDHWWLEPERALDEG